MINDKGQGKLTRVSELVVCIRGGVGQVVAENTSLVGRGEAYYIYTPK